MNPGPALRAALASGLCLALLACTQPVPLDQAVLVGHWRGDGMLLVINANGRAVYERVRGERRTSIDGPVHDISGEGFRIGIGPMSADFEIQRPPTLVDGRWRMTVDGVELTRVEIARTDTGKETIRL